MSGKTAAGVVVLLWTACAALPLHASDLHPLAVTVMESSGDRYFEPAGRRVVIRGQPIRLFIRIRNTSEAAVLVRISPEMAYSIELRDQAGLTSMIKRKRVTGAGKTDEDIRVELEPGVDRIISMDINRDTWDGIPVLEAGKESTYTARVAYETADGQIVYSEPYTLIFSIQQ